MTTPRFDIYRLIHKGLRCCLTETLLTIGKMDPASDHDVRHGIQQLRQLLEFCQSHLEHENEFVHPAMEACQPGSADSMTLHHQHHETMIAELHGAAAQLLQTDAHLRAPLAAALYRNLAVFVADNLAHMHEEETRNNAILWQGYSDDEIRAIEHRIVASLTPEKNAQTMQWMLPAMNHQERHQFLCGMRREAPANVFAMVLEIAREQLGRTDWNKLQFALAC